MDDVPRKDQKRCVILNPRAGSVKDLDAVKKQLRRLEASSFHLTKNEGAAKTFAREAVRDHCDANARHVARAPQI